MNMDDSQIEQSVIISDVCRFGGGPALVPCGWNRHRGCRMWGLDSSLSGQWTLHLSPTLCQVMLYLLVFFTFVWSHVVLDTATLCMTNTFFATIDAVRISVLWIFCNSIETIQKKPTLMKQSSRRAALMTLQHSNTVKWLCYQHTSEVDASAD